MKRWFIKRFRSGQDMVDFLNEYAREPINFKLFVHAGHPVSAYAILYFSEKELN